MPERWGARTLPEVVREGIDGGRSRLGRVLFGLGLVLAGGLSVRYVVAPTAWWPRASGCCAAWVLVVLVVGLGAWLARGKLRVHRSSVARLLRERPESIVRIVERVGDPDPVGRAFRQPYCEFDGELEFAPRERVRTRVMGVPVRKRSWISLHVEGERKPRTLAISMERAPILLEYLFGLMCDVNPSCRWGGETTVRDFMSASDRPASVEAC